MTPEALWGRRAVLAALGLWALNLVYLAVVGLDPGLWDYHYTMGERALSQGHLPGKLAEAEAEYRKAIDYAQLMVPVDGRLARTYHDLGQVYFAEQKYPEARRCYDKALALFAQREGADSYFVGVCRFRQGELSARLGDMPAAEQWLVLAQPPLERVGGPHDVIFLRARLDQALVMCAMGRPREARPILEEFVPRVKGNLNVGDIVFQNEIQRALERCRSTP